jgi:hypothetical protein
MPNTVLYQVQLEYTHLLTIVLDLTEIAFMENASFAWIEYEVHKIQLLPFLLYICNGIQFIYE